MLRKVVTSTWSMTTVRICNSTITTSQITMVEKSSAASTASIRSFNSRPRARKHTGYIRFTIPVSRRAVKASTQTNTSQRSASANRVTELAIISILTIELLQHIIIILIKNTQAIEELSTRFKISIKLRWCSTINRIRIRNTNHPLRVVLELSKDSRIKLLL